MTSRDSHDINEARRMELYDRLMEITRWHAQLQVDFWHDLLGQERMTVADDQG